MSTVETTIRTAERADLLDVLAIERACFADPWTYEAFDRFLHGAERRGGVENAFPGVDADPLFLVAGDPGEVDGYVIADVTPNLGRNIGHVKDLAVRPNARNRGLGRSLLRAALGSLSGRGATVAKLEVREDNDAARSLYADEGFEPARRVPRYYPDGEDALVLVTDLAEWAITGP